jgi:hypothetical protein
MRRHNLAATVHPALFDQALDLRLRDHVFVERNAYRVSEGIRIGTDNSGVAAQECLERRTCAPAQHAACFEDYLTHTQICWLGRRR